MGWPTKTNCDTPRPTLGNPASLLPYVYNPRPLTEQERHAFCNLPDPDPRPISPASVSPRPAEEGLGMRSDSDADDLADYLPSAPPAPVSPRLAEEGLGMRSDSAAPVVDAASVFPLFAGEGLGVRAASTIILIDPDDPAYDEPWSTAPACTQDTAPSSNDDLSYGQIMSCPPTPSRTQSDGINSPIPRLGPVGTSLSEPDNVLSGDLTLPPPPPTDSCLDLALGTQHFPQELPMPTYTADFRDRARLALKAAGYPARRGALIDISHLLNVSRHTLKRWFHQAEPPALHPKTALQPMVQYEVQHLFALLDSKRERANYAQLSRALSQLIEVLHQLE